MGRAFAPRIGSLSCALLIVWLASCQPRVGPHGSTFTRVATPHFTVYSDVSPRRAEQHARELEWMLQGLLENGWEHDGELPLKLNVVLLHDPFDVKVFSGVDFAGYFHGNLLFEPWIVLAAPLLAEGLPTLVHELSHHLAYLALQNQPTWFAEGLASYYETAAIEAGRRFVLGKPRRGRHADLERRGILPASVLFDRELALTPRTYASSWLLVHYLMTRRPDAFVRYQDELARGRSHEDAWARAFPDLEESAAVDRTLQEYFERGTYEVVIADFAPGRVGIESRPLTRADEEALWALLWYGCRRCSRDERVQKARERARRALALDPRQVEARLLTAFLTDDEHARALQLQALTRDAANDYRGWLGLASMQEGPESRVAVEKALALAPMQPAAWMARARYQWDLGDRAAAFESAMRALRMRPTDLSLLAQYAEMLFYAGRCTEMNVAIRRILAIAGREKESLSPKDAASLEEITESCGKAIAR